MGDIDQIVSGLVLMAIGAMGSGIAWIVRSIIKMQSDLNHAFIKIRSLETVQCHKSSPKSE
jgi:hypothetical protein